MALHLRGTIVVGIWSALVFRTACGVDEPARPAPSATAAPRTAPPLDVPRGISLPGSWSGQLLFVKPGHWTECRFETRGGPNDFRGTMALRLLTANEPLAATEGATWENRRSAVVPQGEMRPLDGAFFTPTICKEHSCLQPVDAVAPLKLEVRLIPQGLSTTTFESRWPVVPLRNHQALLVVLAARPEAYRYLPKLDVVAAPGHDFQTADDAAHYRVVTVDDEPRAPLPESLSGWTTTSYAVWDDYDLGRCSDAQRRALIDWVHWGGTLIVSGPGAPTGAAAELLAELLPARAGPAETLRYDRLRPLNEAWTTPGGAPPKITHDWPGVQLTPIAGAEVIVGSGDAATPLTVERRCGRGRCVMTAFSLAERDLVDWPSFDGFWNGCLMRRPSRSGALRVGTWTLGWSDHAAWYDPTRTGGVRLAVRDDGRNRPYARDRGEARPQYARELGVGPGVAAWRDDGPIVEAAVRALRAEAAIVVPGVGFVVGIVAAYFVVLVPLNWLVFRLFGRPERAWLAAPCIALGFAGAVVYLAELDIGFARSSHEVTVVELQPGYARGHVSRFVAVYNSLGTKYEIVGDASMTALTLGDPTTPRGVASSDAATSDAPSINVPSPRVRQALVRSVGAERNDGPAVVAISGFAVESNSAALLRVEQMTDCGGPIDGEALGDGTYRVTNRTRYDLRDVRIRGRGEARLERLHPGESKTFAIEPRPFGRRFGSSRDDVPPTEALHRAVGDFAAGELRLTAAVSEPVGGFDFRPSPTQRRAVTLVVAHLAYDATPAEHDLNVRPTSE